MSIHACPIQLTKDLEKSQNVKSCQLESLLSTWIRIQEKAPDLTIHEIQNFLKNAKDWPLEDVVRRRAEKILQDHHSPQALYMWFTSYPPVSTEGHLLFLKALVQLGKNEEAKNVARQIWIHQDLLPKKEKEILDQYGKYLTPSDLSARISRLILQQKLSQLPFYAPDTSDKQGWSFQIACQQGKVTHGSFQSLDKAHQLDSSLRLDYVRWLRKQNEDDLAYSTIIQTKFNHPSEDLAEAWWKEINIIARRFIENGEFKKAYDMIRMHQLKKGESFANAEWLRGWLLTEFLAQHNQAAEIFKNLFQNVKTPISRSRASFWAGEAHKRHGDTQQSKDWFYKAGHYFGTFYAQIALSQLPKTDQHIVTSASVVHPINAGVKKAILNDPLVKATLILGKTSFKAYQIHFIREVAKKLNTQDEQHAFLNIVSEINNQHALVEAAKKMSYKNVILHPAAYPILPSAWFCHQDAHSLAIFYSLIRQESQFRPDVVSPAGASGLMQLMPETARFTARKHKVKSYNLFTSKHNVNLGSRHFMDLMQEFNGSVVLSICAYNAGKAAVNKWIQIFGHPTKDNFLRWIELIPFYETRNYVQRVLENYFIYRHRVSSNVQNLGTIVSLETLVS